jgi:ribose-phosphate pyrophosphokinase
MITLFKDGVKLPFKQWKFPGGEVGVQLSDVDVDATYTVHMEYENSDDVMVFLNVCDALQEYGVSKHQVCGSIPYFPYARQDRVCNKGESRALEMFVQVLSCAFCWKIYTKDVHSSVALALCDDYGVFLVDEPHEDCAVDLPVFDVLIAPDKGAENKASMHNQYMFGSTSLVCLSKTRVGSQVVYMDYAYDTIKGTVCVVDDLCDGGFTFISLGEMLKRTQPNITSLNLYVTHGLFSKGIDILEGLYEKVYVHNLMNKEMKPHGRLVLV